MSTPLDDTDAIYADAIYDEQFIEINGCPVGRPIGWGAMGTVYEWKPPSSDVVRAVKVIAVQQTEPTTPQDEQSESKFEQFRKRFIQEYNVLKTLKHDNIVRVYDFGTVDGGKQLYFTMDHLKGESLVKTKSLDLREVVYIGREIAKGLEHAHRNDIIHRDVKESNVVYNRIQESSGDGRVTLVDFGICRVGERKLTEAGQPAPGTPKYQAPECQVANGRMDHRSDIYSLGVMLTSLYPRFGESEKDTQIVLDPAELSMLSILKKCRHLDPEQRFQSAAEAIQAFDEWEHQCYGNINNPVSNSLPETSETVVTPTAQRTVADSSASSTTVPSSDLTGKEANHAQPSAANWWENPKVLWILIGLLALLSTILSLSS